MSMLGVRIVVVVASALVGPCVAPSALWAVSYEDDILPILRAECLGCHNEDDRQGELDLSTYDAVLDGGASGAVIDPGDPDGSLLYRLVAHLDQPSMPPETPMIARESVELIERWISEGALETSAKQSQRAVTNKPAASIPVSTALQKGRVHFPPRLPRANRMATKNDPAIVALCASPSTPLVAIGGVRQVWFFRTDTLDCVGRLPYSEGDIRCVQFSLDGSILLVAGGWPGRSGNVDLWDVKEARKVFSIGDLLDEVRAVAISSDHQRVAVASTGPTIYLYELPSGKRVKKIVGHTDWITDLAFSDDGVLLASADRSGGLRLWESWSGDLYEMLDGHKRPIYSLEWTSDSNYISSAGADGFIRIWSAEDGKETQKIKAHVAGPVRHIRRPSGGWASAGKDKILHVWNPQGQSLRALAPFSDMPTAIAWSVANNKIITGDYLGRAVVHDGHTFEADGVLVVNPESIDEQIRQARVEHKTQDSQRTEIREQLKLVEEQLAGVEVAFAEAQADYDKLLKSVTELNEDILSKRMELRQIQANISSDSGKERNLSRLYVTRKLALNELRQLSAIHGAESKRLLELEGKQDAARKKNEGLALRVEQLRGRQTQSAIAAKQSLIDLASLIEEAAFSTSYEFLEAEARSPQRP